MNLAGVLPWIHWRGLLILALLVAGNFFCMACPVHAAAATGQPLAGLGPRSGRDWLRTKWLAVVLAGPVSLGLRSRFAVGQPVDGRPGLSSAISWQRLPSTVSFGPARSASTSVRSVSSTSCSRWCRRWRSKSARRSSVPRARRTIASAVAPTIPGCQTRLFQPHKSSNMDCTFCLDCVHACPHDNVGLIAGLSGSANCGTIRFRSGIGRFGTRTDLAALVVVLMFGALTNAAGMVGPVVEWQDQLRSTLVTGRNGSRPAW